MPHGYLNQDGSKVTWHALSLTLVKAESHSCQDGGKPQDCYLLENEPGLSAKAAASCMILQGESTDTHSFSEQDLNSRYMWDIL